MSYRSHLIDWKPVGLSSIKADTLLPWSKCEPSWGTGLRFPACPTDRASVKQNNNWNPLINICKIKSTCFPWILISICIISCKGILSIHSFDRLSAWSEYPRQMCSQLSNYELLYFYQVYSYDTSNVLIFINWMSGTHSSEKLMRSWN